MQEISGRTRVCGLMANPVEHTMSPMLHNTLAEQMGISFVYVPFKPEEGTIQKAVQGAYALNILGLNVSIPFKQEVIKSLREIDENAAKIGSVNTLVRTKDGYKGYNTDYLGLKRMLDEIKLTLNGKRVILLGAGGVAKTAAYLCRGEGVKELYILNRTLNRAAELAAELAEGASNIRIKPMKLEDYPAISGEQYVVIQTTSVGMYPNVKEAIIKESSFYKKIHTAVDLIYTPFETAFMKKAAEQGAQAYNGLKMLLYQGISAFELWNEVKVDSETARNLYCHLERELKKE